MIMLRKIFLSSTFVCFFILHLVFLNVNYAEWGDSYRILRAAEFIRRGDYPENEKRPPLYSMLLAIRPESVDQVFWGRGVMFGISVASYVVFCLVLNKTPLQEKQKKLALILFAFNPVYFYWSIRLMADSFFSLLVMLIFYFYLKWKDTAQYKILPVLSLLSGLAVLTRFEGYLLVFSVGVSILIANREVNYKIALIYGLFTALILLPWYLFRSPLDSSYFSEPATRSYNIQTLMIYFISLLYVFGFSSGWYFAFKGRYLLWQYLKKYTAIWLFVTLELSLALVWPAAIPRLFVPVIPFLIIFLSFGVFQNEECQKSLLPNILLLLIYILGQWLLKLQFLVLMKPFFIAVIITQFIQVYLYQKKQYLMYTYFVCLTLIIWSVSTILLHKNIFKSLIEANKYVIEHLSGNIAYNDVSSVTDWYLNQKNSVDGIEGFYLALDDKKGRGYNLLREKSVDFVMITNEHNPDLAFKAEESQHFEEIIEFSYNVGRTNFFTKILKVNGQN